MKKVITYLVLLILILSCSDKGNFTCKITGEILDRKNGNLFLYRPESSRFDKDTIPFSEGKFEYYISLKYPEVYWLFFEEDENDDNRINEIRFFIEPGKVNITMSCDDIFEYGVDGGKYNKELFPIENKLQMISKENKRLGNKFYASNDSLEKSEIIKQIDSLRSQRITIINENFKNSNVLHSAYYLWLVRNMTDINELKKYLPMLAKKFPLSRYIIETNAFIEGYGKNLPNQSFTDFTLINIDGNELKISETVRNNKVTLICFWSSRCANSDSKLSSYKAIYDEYKNKGFQIVGIANDFNKARWQKAVDRNKAFWINLIDVDGIKAVGEYYHSSTEGDALVDRNGVVLTRIKQPSDLTEKLKELLD